MASGDDAASPARKVAAAWKRPGDGSPAAGAVMDAESWPALPGLAAPSSPSTGAVVSGASDTNPDRAAPAPNPQRRGLPTAGHDGPEKHAAVAVHVPSTRHNDGGAADHQFGRFTPHPHGRGSGGYGGGNRRGNGGGGGGGRRGQEHHGGFDGHHRRGGGRRDGHGPGHQHQQCGPQLSYIRAPHPVAVVAPPPPPPPPFVGMAPPQAPPFGTPVGFPDMVPHVYYFAAPPSEGIQGMPFVPHPASPPAILVPQLEGLQAELLRQIEYYFSDDNLCKDIFLRKNMDEQGWVPLMLIAGFNQVRKMTNNLQFILDTVLLSTVVEVQGDKIRRRTKWENWLLPQPSYSADNSSDLLSPVTSNIDALASQFQSVGLEGATYHISSRQGMPSEAVFTRSMTSGSLGYKVPPTLGGVHSNGSEPLIGGPNPVRSLFRNDTF